MKHHLLIYTEIITPRIEYTFDFIFREFSGINFMLTSDIELYKSTNLARLNFSNQVFDKDISLKVDKILLEEHVNPHTNYQQLSNIGKCFFWLSRYEEYIAKPHQFDQHQRFLGSDLDYSQPIVDEICLSIQRLIREKYPHFPFKKRVFRQINTHDVDFAWKYLYHSPFIKYGSLVKKLIKGDFEGINQQIKILLGKSKDPYDTFDYYRSLAEQHQKETIFFWLLGDYSRFDKNHSYHNKNQITLIQSVARWAKIGIHPSYQSNLEPNLLKKEIDRLHRILQQPIKLSRQHFIKLNFPHTYQHLLINGINEDYTMGFPHKLGYRAGTSTPFLWFDLSTNQQTMLTIYPFVAMDVTLKNYLNLTPEDAIKELKLLKQKTKNVDGTFITLFHQSNLEGEWEPWRKVYESLFHD